MALITSKSISHSNVVFLFKEENFVISENAELAGLYQGPSSTGAGFLDDPALKTKILTLPALKIKIILEKARLRVEDDSQEEPKNSCLINEAHKVQQKLFSGHSIIGFGFNFDIYYRYSDVIRINALFGSFVDRKILENVELRDIGAQFTLEREGGKRIEQYFFKVVSPLEIVLHVNYHFNAFLLPASPMGQAPECGMQGLFEECYAKTDDIMKNLLI